MDSVCEIVRTAEEDYTSGSTTISKYVEFDMYETVNTIDAYINSVHLSGSVDALGREKPFFNIVIAARNIWFRATDIDRKDIRLTSTKSNQVVLTLVANILLKNWMKKANFGATLNDWGRALATYGSAVMKFVEKDGELHCSVVPWNRLVPDVIDFENNVKIEVLEYTPAQLRKNKAYNQEMVETLLNSLSTRKDLDKQNKDNKDGYVRVYEVHGEMPLSMITGKESDEDTYTQQMHVVSFVRKNYNRSKRSYDYEDYTLYSGKESQDPYYITHLIKEDGRTLAIGAVENLFQAQWMANHSVKLQKDILDFTSLLVFQTSDPNLVGRNAFSDLIIGDFLVHAENQPATQLNNSHDTTQIANFGMMWSNLSKEITSTPDAMRGETQPSGTAWRQVEALRMESHSLFEIMKENKGLAIEEMLRRYIIPHLKTKMDTSDEITAVLEDNDLAQFDAMYVPNEARRRNNKRIIEQILGKPTGKFETRYDEDGEPYNSPIYEGGGQIAENGDLATLENEVKNELAPLGKQRFIKPSDIPDTTWKELLEDYEWEPDINITEEAVGVQETLATLNTLLQTAVNDPDLYKFIVSKILATTGHISPVELPVSKPRTQLSPEVVATGQKTPDFQATK